MANPRTAKQIYEALLERGESPRSAAPVAYLFHLIESGGVPLLVSLGWSNSTAHRHQREYRSRLLGLQGDGRELRHRLDQAS